MLLLFIALMVPADAAAWDFTCSPAETTIIGHEIPAVMLMLDRSGSMSDSNGRVASTCKVCEVDGEYVEVASAADCSGSGIPWSFTQSQTLEQDGHPLSGYEFEYLFYVPPARDSLQLEIIADADLNGSCEYADIYVDGDLVHTISNGGNCSPTTHVIPIDTAYASNGQVEVHVVTSPDNNTCAGRNTSCADNASCDGVDTFCDGGNHFTVTVANVEPTYLGTQSWEDPCGSLDKWEQALAAIDAVASEAQSSSPELVHFGLGLFSGNSASIEEECASASRDDVMSTLNSTSPSGSTPTARAIQTALQSSCVSGRAYASVSAGAWLNKDDSNTGYELVALIDDIEPGREVELELTTFGDYGGGCEFADVVVDGVAFGRISDSTDCRSGGFVRSWDIPAAFVADGRLVVQLVTRGDGEASDFPSCSNEDGVDARCTTNGFSAVVRWLDDDPPPTATILINDGEPTRDLDNSSTNAYLDAVLMACDHREIAPLFVLGLGAGTDVDFNDILAAAGGSGGCTSGTSADVDVCDDPGDWAALRGRCTGSIQASNRDGLLEALLSVTTALGCTFDINFLNSGFDRVPADVTNEYDMLFVDAQTTSATEERIQYWQSATTEPGGEGWRFAGDQRQSITLTDHFCTELQSHSYIAVTTQLACMCQEATGEACDVPDAVALDVCPTGTWACNEGTDWCEPDASCCVPGEACRVPDTHGACAEGVRVCDTLIGSCAQVVTPGPEVCDGVDNDCNGVMDDIPSSCTVVGEVGRCAVGTRTCNGANEECESLFGPMPELCNGLDDDCDGVVDNISVSWSRTEFAPYKGNQPARARSCQRDDVCMCDSGATDDHAGPTFSAYVDAWDPVCQCGDSLGPAEPLITTTEASNVAPTAGCSKMGAGPQAPTWVLLLLFALIGRRF